MNFLTTESTEITEKEGSNSLTGKIIGAAIEIHRALGPGLLESAYEACLIYELRLKKLRVEPQKSMPVYYKDVYLDCGYRVDVVVENQIIPKLPEESGI
jgi:GxxExxY protein